VQRELTTARDRSSSGELLEPPSKAELAATHGHRPLQPRDRRAPFPIPNTIRSHRPWR
jgi:hypothetical protein